MDLFQWAEKRDRKPIAPPLQNPCTPPADPPPELAPILSVLARAIGRRQAMTAPQIAMAASLWPDLGQADRGTRVRQIIRTWYEHFARDGYVLIALSTGFWYTEDPEDIAQYELTTLSRIRETAITLKRTRLQAQVSARMTRAGKGRWESPSHAA